MLPSKIGSWHQDYPGNSPFDVRRGIPAIGDRWNRWDNPFMGLGAEACLFHVEPGNPGGEACEDLVGDGPR